MSNYLMALSIPVLLIVVAWIALAFDALVVAGIIISFAIIYGFGRYVGINKYVPFLLVSLLSILWGMLVFGITTSFWVVFLGVIIFGWGMLFSIFMYDFIGNLSGKLVGIGVIMVILGLFLILLPFAPQIFL